MDTTTFTSISEETANKIWTSACEKLISALGQDVFELYLQPAKPVEISSGVLALELPNRFFTDWVQQNAHAIVLRAVREAAASFLQEEIRDVEYRVAHDVDNVLRQPDGEATPVAVTPALVSFESDGGGGLDSKFTFDSFVVGPSNALAHAAARAVAEKPGRTYNPLFLHGGVGLGKTHLLCAIGHEMKRRDPQARVLYCTAEHFANEMIEAIRNSRMPEFHRKYRSLHALLLDDVQFLARGEQIQEVFHHTFNELVQARAAVVLSADEPPKNIRGLQDRLRSRFEWGLPAEIEPPDFETRLAILREKAKREGIYVPEDVLLYIAEQVRTNIRVLEGALMKVAANSLLLGQEISVDRARTLLRDILRPQEEMRPLTTDRILHVTARYFRLEPRELTGKRRTEQVALARQVAIYLCRKMTDLSSPEVGEAFGGRDHSTVLHAEERIQERMEKDPIFRQEILRLQHELRGNAGG